MKQALIIIDMQNGFLNPESPLCIRDARATVPACAKVIAACREAGVPVIFVNRAYRADGSDVEHTRYKVWAEGGKPLTPGSTGPLSVENPPEFGRCPQDYEIIKPRYSAFFPDLPGPSPAPPGRGHRAAHRHHHAQLHPHHLLRRHFPGLQGRGAVGLLFLQHG